MYTTHFHVILKAYIKYEFVPLAVFFLCINFNTKFLKTPHLVFLINARNNN